VGLNTGKQRVGVIFMLNKRERKGKKKKGKAKKVCRACESKRR